MTTPPVLEFRVALTADDYDKLVTFYQEGLGLNPDQLWTDVDGRGMIFDMGRATLEILDQQHAANVDNIETGQRTSGQIRFAFQVPDLQFALERALAYGATLVHDPVITPWRHHNARITSPDGLQITLFQVLTD